MIMEETERNFQSFSIQSGEEVIIPQKIARKSLLKIIENTKIKGNPIRSFYQVPHSLFGRSEDYDVELFSYLLTFRTIFNLGDPLQLDLLEKITKDLHYDYFFGHKLASKSERDEMNLFCSSGGLNELIRLLFLTIGPHIKYCETSSPSYPITELKRNCVPDPITITQIQNNLILILIFNFY
eukprot:c4755_g1_i1.p1 GENE.c4755_g1_i1~~c4755_g1_i1.p1  ORF type:complete len:205 (+),score=46.92 c4755_g1_i1:70-615(+)